MQNIYRNLSYSYFGNVTGSCVKLDITTSFIIF